MKLELLGFLSLYQYACYKQYVEVCRDETKEKKEVPFVVTWDEKAMDENSDRGIFFSLVNFTNVGMAPQPSTHFCFMTRTYERKQYEIFGQDYAYNLYFGINTANGRIVIIDADDFSRTDVAKDAECFLAVLKYYFEYSAIGRVGNEEKVIRHYRDKCVELAGGTEFKHFYTFIFPLKPE